MFRVPASPGLSLDELSRTGHTLVVDDVEPGLWGVSTSPRVGIGQRALLLQTEAGNLLWDPTGFVDEASAELVRGLGGVAVIAASHPHMFGAQLEWSRLFGGAPVLVAEADREWVQRPGPAIRFWTGTEEVLPGVTLRVVGGHFPGSAVAYWDAGAGGRGSCCRATPSFPPRTASGRPSCAATRTRSRCRPRSSTGSRRR